MVLDVLILAGGKGTRLKSLSGDLPKPLMPVNKTSFIEILINKLPSNLVHSVHLSLGYHPEKFNFLREKYSNLNFIVEKDALGTGGAIRFASSFLKTENVLIMNGDSFCDYDLSKMLDFHLEKNSDLTILSVPVKNNNRYGSIHTDSNKRILAFNSNGAQSEESMVNAGVYIIRESLFESINKMPEIFSWESDFLQKKCNEFLMHSYSVNSYFIDIGIPEDYLKLQNEFGKLYNQ